MRSFPWHFAGFKAVVGQEQVGDDPSELKSFLPVPEYPIHLNNHHVQERVSKSGTSLLDSNVDFEQFDTRRQKQGQVVGPARHSRKGHRDLSPPRALYG